MLIAPPQPIIYVYDALPYLHRAAGYHTLVVLLAAASQTHMCMHCGKTTV